MADEIHPTQPLPASLPVDISEDGKHHQHPGKKNEQRKDNSDEAPPKRPPKTGIIDEYV